MIMRKEQGESAPSYLIRPLETRAEYRACYGLQELVWGEDCTELVAPSHLMLARRIGGVAAGAFTPDGVLAGFVYGLTGIQDGRPVHWSDMLAVHPDHRDTGLGLRLKRWQREAVVPMGVEMVYWTFDPLESRNAYLNFARLGVVSNEYARDLYGDTDSPLHAGLGTDRLIVRWPIASERVRGRLETREDTRRPGDDAGMPLVNPGSAGAARTRGRPRELNLDLDVPVVRIAIPADIQSLKTRAPETALEWRRHTRDAFERYFARGYTAVDVVREGDRSHYILSRDYG